MHQELSKDGESHKLGDVKTTPLDLHTLGLHTSKFCFSINTLYVYSYEFLSKDNKRQVMHLSITTNVTPQKGNGRNGVLKFFQRNWKRCTMSYPRMVKAISLGM